jgi:hypothetical protein
VTILCHSSSLCKFPAQYRNPIVSPILHILWGNPETAMCSCNVRKHNYPWSVHYYTASTGCNSYPKFSFFPSCFLLSYFLFSCIFLVCFFCSSTNCLLFHCLFLVFPLLLMVSFYFFFFHPLFFILIKRGISLHDVVFRHLYFYLFLFSSLYSSSTVVCAIWFLQICN